MIHTLKRKGLLDSRWLEFKFEDEDKAGEFRRLVRFYSDCGWPRKSWSCLSNPIGKRDRVHVHLDPWTSSNLKPEVFEHFSELAARVGGVAV